MKKMWVFYVAATVLFGICASCAYARKKPNDSTADSTTDIRNYPVDADGMEKKIEPLSFQFLEGEWQLYDAINGSFQLLMSFNDEGTHKIDGGNYITVHFKNCDKNTEEVVASILAIPDGNFCHMAFEDYVDGIANKGMALLSSHNWDILNCSCNRCNLATVEEIKTKSKISSCKRFR